MTNRRDFIVKFAIVKCPHKNIVRPKLMINKKPPAFYNQWFSIVLLLVMPGLGNATYIYASFQCQSAIVLRLRLYEAVVLLIVEFTKRL